MPPTRQGGPGHFQTRASTPSSPAQARNPLTRPPVTAGNKGSSRLSGEAALISEKVF